MASTRAGPVIWVGVWRGAELVDADGLATFFDPGRLVLVDAPAAKNALWAMEEALRSGAAALVICELSDGLDLTPSRRLQLAAEAGDAARRGGVLGLAITPETSRGRGNAVETRWSATPMRAAAGWSSAPAWRWSLRKNKRGPCGEWLVRWEEGGLDAVSASPVSGADESPGAVA